MAEIRANPAGVLSKGRSWLVWLFMEDHCPWANAYVRRLRHPLVVLSLCGAASLLCGLFVAAQGYVVAGICAAVIVIGLAWPAVALRGVRCRLEFTAPRGRAEQATSVVAHVTNRWPWPVWGLRLERGFELADDAERPEVALASVGAWSQASFSWEFVPTRRGSYPRTAPQIATDFPFGLWKAMRPAAVAERCIVWPATLAATALHMPSGTPGWCGEPSGRLAGSSGERLGVRDYRAGDALRLVHWAKTASRDRLIVSERQGVVANDVSLELDARDPMHGDDAAAIYEAIVRVAAAMCEQLLTTGAGVTLVVQGAQRHVRARPREGARLLDWLATHDEGDPLTENRRTTRRAGAPPVWRVTARVGRDGRWEAVVLCQGTPNRVLARYDRRTNRLIADQGLATSPRARGVQRLAAAGGSHDAQ